MITFERQIRSASGRCQIVLAALAASVLAVSCGGQSNDGEIEPIVIKFPHVMAPATPKGLAAEHFKELVDERLGGRVIVEIYPGSQLMNDDDSLDALAFGEIQMIAVSLSKLDRLTHKFQVFDLPFLFPDLATVERFQGSELGKSLLTSLEDKGMLGLTYWHNGMKQFTGPVPLNTPENAKGLKFRIMESDVLEAQVLQIGGSPQKMAYGEVYQALQTGAVDAHENTWSNIYSSKFYEVQDYLTETNHGYVGYLVTVNEDFWKSLPADVRTELESIVLEVAGWANARSATINAEARTKIEQSGSSTIVTLTDEELEAWQQAMRPVWTLFEDSIGPEMIQAALSAQQ